MSIKNLLPGKIGLGGAPLGNMFRAIPEDEAHATVSEAWNLGVRYFDTAPLYGSGLSEIRMGEALSQYPRDEYVLSSKVGRIMLDEMEDPAKRDFGEKGGLFEHGLKNKILNDYSADATLRSIEDSLKRLKTDRLDIVWIHDPAQDFYGDSWLEQFNIARTGAFRALTRLRDEGVIKAWGLGVNRVEPCELTLALDVTGENIIETKIVTDAGNMTNVGNGNRRVARTVFTVATGQLFGKVHSVAMGAAVAAGKHFATSFKAVC